MFQNMPCRFVQIQIFHITMSGRRVGVVREETIISPRLFYVQGGRVGLGQSRHCLISLPTFSLRYVYFAFDCREFGYLYRIPLIKSSYLGFKEGQFGSDCICEIPSTASIPGLPLL